MTKGVIGESPSMPFKVFQNSSMLHQPTESFDALGNLEFLDYGPPAHMVVRHILYCHNISQLDQETTI